MFRIVKDEGAVQDIIQETFLRLWLHRDKMPAIENPRSWILRIAYYRAFEYLRDKALYEKKLQGLSGRPGAADDGPDTRLAFSAIEREISRAIALLPPQQKKVYRLSREAGLPIAAIAEEMGLSPQSVKNTLGRALKFIREHLEKAGYGWIWLLLLFFP